MPEAIGRHDGVRDALAARSDRFGQVGQGIAEHEFHDQKEFAIFGDDVEDGNDVGMAHSRRHPRFVEQHGAERRVLREVRVKPLDRDRACETCRAKHPPHVDRGHPAGRDLVEERVAAEEALGGLASHPTMVPRSFAAHLISRPSTSVIMRCKVRR